MTGWVLPSRVEQRSGQVRNESHIELVDATRALQQHQEARAAIKARSRSAGRLASAAARAEKTTSLVETEETSRAIAKSISGSSSKQVSLSHIEDLRNCTHCSNPEVRIQKKLQ